MTQADTEYRNEIIEMAVEAGFAISELHCSPPIITFAGQEDAMQALIKLVAAKEREACLNCYSPGDDVTDWVDKILARGEA